MAGTSTEARILVELNINAEQIQIYDTLTKVEELDDVRVHPSMIPQGTKIPGTNRGDNTISQLGVRAGLPSELCDKAKLRDLLGRYGLGDRIESCDYNSQVGVNGVGVVKIKAGQSHGLVDNVPKTIDHFVSLYITPADQPEQ